MKKRIGRTVKRNKKTGSTFGEKLIIIATIVIYYFFVQTSGEIINYPTWLSWSSFLILAVPVGYWMWKQVNEGLRKEKGFRILLYSALLLLAVFVGAMLAQGFFLLPLNYYNIHYSKKNPVEHIECEITKVAVERRKQIVYNFNGKRELLRAYDPVMLEMKAKGNYRDYRLVLGARRALFGSYCLESWEIVRKYGEPVLR
jgi:hypothetical protein